MVSVHQWLFLDPGGAAILVPLAASSELASDIAKASWSSGACWFRRLESRRSSKRNAFFG